jgi:hypothetical protein
MKIDSTTKKAYHVPSVGNFSTAKAIHERICLLYLMLTDERAELLVTDWGIDTGYGLAEFHSSDCPKRREDLFKGLVDALFAHEVITGKEDHPVNEKPCEIVY